MPLPCQVLKLTANLLSLTRTATLHPICLPSWDLTRRVMVRNETGVREIRETVDKLTDSSWEGQQFLYSIKVTTTVNIGGHFSKCPLILTVVLSFEF